METGGAEQLQEQPVKNREDQDGLRLLHTSMLERRLLSSFLGRKWPSHRRQKVLVVV